MRRVQTGKNRHKTKKQVVAVKVIRPKAQMPQALINSKLLLLHPLALERRRRYLQQVMHQLDSLSALQQQQLQQPALVTLVITCITLNSRFVILCQCLSFPVVVETVAFRRSQP